MLILNSTLINDDNEQYDYSDNFPLPYEDENLTNRTYYDDYLLNNNAKSNLTNSDLISLTSILNFSTPFSYIFLILFIYLILTVLLLTFSLYKQRQNDIENFYLGDNDEDIQQNKRVLLWKKFLIGKIRKGDMEPLLIEQDSQSDQHNHLQSIKTTNFPLKIV